MKHFFILLVLPCFLKGQAWFRVADFPGTKRDDGVSVTVNNVVYAGSGLQEGWSSTIDFYAFYPGTLTWSLIPGMPHTTERQYACAFPGPDCFYVFGGDGVGGALNNLYKYDIQTKVWTKKNSKPGSGLIAASCLSFGDTVVFVGGKTAGPGPLNSEVWQYVISSDAWIQKNPFPFTPTWRSSASVIHNKGYLLFGIDSLNRFRKEMYRYSLQTDSWQYMGDFPGTGRAYAGMASTGKRLVVFGGVDSLNQLYKDVWQYNDVSDLWINAPYLPSDARKGGMLSTTGDMVVYSCGISANGRLNETWIMDVPTGLPEGEDVSRLHFYPNPVQDKLTIERRGELQPLKLHCLIRQLSSAVVVVTSELSESTELDLGEVIPGVYLLEIWDETKKLRTEKLIRL